MRAATAGCCESRKKVHVSALAVVSCPARKKVEISSISSSRVNPFPVAGSRAAIAAPAMSSSTGAPGASRSSSSVPMCSRMLLHAATTPAGCGTSANGLPSSSVRMSTCATRPCHSAKLVNTSRAARDSSPRVKMVRVMMSAVSWLMAVSSASGVPVAACSSSTGSKSSTAATIAPNARFTRMCENAGSIIARWRFQRSPCDTKIDSPTSGMSAPTMRSLLGNTPSGSARMRLTSSGAFTSRMPRRDEPSGVMRSWYAWAGSRESRSRSRRTAVRMSDASGPRSVGAGGR